MGYARAGSNPARNVFILSFLKSFFVTLLIFFCPHILLLGIIPVNNWISKWHFRAVNGLQIHMEIIKLRVPQQCILVFFPPMCMSIY